MFDFLFTKQQTKPAVFFLGKLQNPGPSRGDPGPGTRDPAGTGPERRCPFPWRAWSSCWRRRFRSFLETTSPELAPPFPFFFFAFLGSPLFSSSQAKTIFFAGFLIPAKTRGLNQAGSKGPFGGRIATNELGINFWSVLGESVLLEHLSHTQNPGYKKVLVVGSIYQGASLAQFLSHSQMSHLLKTRVDEG